MAEITRIFDLLNLYRKNYSDKINAFGFKSQNVWNSYSSADYTDYADRFSKGLIRLGVKKGDKVATIMSNCPEWNFIDMGLMQIGAIQIPIYPNISRPNYSYIFKDAQVKYIFVQNNEVYDRIKPATIGIKSLKEIYTIDKTFAVKNWRQILTLGDNVEGSELNQLKAEIKPHDIATIIYTSGTTGKPKGVMLSHKNFIFNFISCAKISDLTANDRALSFLPLCHVYERMLNYLYQYLGLSIYYAENFESISSNISDIKPHVFCTVPRVLEKIYDRIYQKGLELSFLKKKLFFWSIRLGEKYEIKSKNGWRYWLKHKIADLLIYRHWRKALGNNVKLVISGGASLQPRLTRLFWAAGIYIMEGYGLTETSPVISVQTFDKNGFKFGTVGPVIDGVEVMIASDGEILCRGPNVMIGYLNRPELTNEIIDEDGWFHTGDIGVMEDGRFLKITDRKKEIFKTSGGKYVAPQVVENKFKTSPFIENIMVIGEDHKFPAALICPNFSYLESWCKNKDIPFSTNESILKNALVIDRFNNEIDRLNNDIDKVEQVKKFEFITDEWTTESGELSPTLKLRRKFIMGKYREMIAQIYTDTCD